MLFRLLGDAACEDHGAADHLNVSLAQAVQVSADSHGAAGDVGQGESLLREPFMCCKIEAEERVRGLGMLVLGLRFSV